MELISDDIIIKSSVKEELPELETVYGEAMGLVGFDRLTPAINPAKYLRGFDMAFSDRGNHEMLSIYIAEMLVGYVALCRDFPGKQFVRIEFLYIAQPARGKGFGSRVLCGIKKFFRDADYGSIRARVSLRNWNAMRFLTARGFNRIMSIQTDGCIESGGCGALELECTL